MNDIVTIIMVLFNWAALGAGFIVFRRALRDENGALDVIKRFHKLDLEAAWAEGYLASQDDVRSGRRSPATNPYRVPRETAS